MAEMYDYPFMTWQNIDKLWKTKANEELIEALKAIHTRLNRLETPTPAPASEGVEEIHCLCTWSNRQGKRFSNGCQIHPETATVATSTSSPVSDVETCACGFILWPEKYGPHHLRKCPFYSNEFRSTTILATSTSSPASVPGLGHVTKPSPLPGVNLAFSPMRSRLTVATSDLCSLMSYTGAELAEIFRACSILERIYESHFSSGSTAAATSQPGRASHE